MKSVPEIKREEIDRRLLQALQADEGLDLLQSPEEAVSNLMDKIDRICNPAGMALRRPAISGQSAIRLSRGLTGEGLRRETAEVTIGGTFRGAVDIYFQSDAPEMDQVTSAVIGALARGTFRELDKAVLLDNYEQRLNELNTLYEASRVISAAPDLNRVLSFLMSLAEKILNCDSGLAILSDDSRRNLKLEYIQGEAATSGEDLEALLEGDLYTSVEQLRKPAIQDCDHGTEFLAGVASRCSWLKSYVALPLRVEGRNIGLLVLASSMEISYPTELIRLLTIISSQAAVILKNTLSYKRQVEQKTLELSALYYASARLSSASSAEEANLIILDIIGGVVDYDESHIYVFDDLNERLILNASRSADNAPEEVVECNDRDNVFAWAVSEGKVVVSSDISGDRLFRNSFCRGMRSAMVIPLVVEHKTIGILSVSSRTPGAYSEEHARMLSIIASQAAATYKALEVLDTVTSHTVNILRSIASGVVAVDTGGKIYLWNAAMEKFIRRGHRQALGRDLRQVMEEISPTVYDEIEAIKRQVLRYGKTVRGHEISLPGRKGEMIFNLNCSRLKNSSGEILGVVLVFEDITERKNIEDQVRRISQLATIGQLAASVAHEIRNPLSSIKGAAQLLHSEMEQQGHLAEYAAIISQETDRLNAVVTDFLTFSRPQPPRLRRQDMNAVITHSLDLLSGEMEKSGIKIKRKLSDRLPEIYVDGDQMEQVFINLILNAIQAMDGGTLGISSTATRKKRDRFGGPTRFIRVDIIDNGCGISREDMDKIFVPFFTTKSEGSGLGLSIVHQIVESHGGYIRISSLPGRGSVFSVYIPCRSRDEAENLMRSCPGSPSADLVI